MGKVTNGKVGSGNGGVDRQTLKKVCQRKMGKFLEWSCQKISGEVFGKETFQKCHFRAQGGFKILPGNNTKMLHKL
jgi:hypothetical protein